MLTFVKFFIVLFVIFSVFIYGFLSATLKIFPYEKLQPLAEFSSSLKEALSIDEYSNIIRWEKEASGKNGTVKYDAENARDGYTLYIGTQDTTARLVDMNGHEVYHWSFNYNDVWKDQKTVQSLSPLDDSYFYLRDFHLFPNGDIILMVTAGGTTPWGVGLLKLDKDSNLLWKYTNYVNNDFELGPDGQIYAIVHNIRYDRVDSLNDMPIPFLEDNIVLLDRDGQEQKKISLFNAFETSDYAGLLEQLREDPDWDPLHTNAIEYVERDYSDIPWLKKGYLLLSIRNLNAFAVLDPEAERIVFAKGLSTRMQHDVDLLENGHVMFFDNRGNFGNYGYTRIIELDENLNRIIWSYDGSQEQRKFDNHFFGEQERLDNENTLIVSPYEGRIFEISPAKEIVWDYYTPLVKKIEGKDHTSAITHTKRIDKQYIKFGLE